MRSCIALYLILVSLWVDAAAELRSEQVDALFDHMNAGRQPGAAVMVIDHGGVVYSNGFGFADIEKGIRIDENSTFRLGSVSKQFTAAAVQTLIESGELQLGDPLVDYVPELSMYPGITIRHLLTHTSGLPDYYDVIEITAGMPETGDVVSYVADMKTREFAPGEQYAYSNPAYEVLVLVVEAASGRTFSDYIQQNVFAPAGMRGALIHDHIPIDIDNRVMGYDCGPGGIELNDYDPLNNIVGSGGVYATLNDFFAWDQSLYTNAVLSASSRKEAFTKAHLNDGSTIDYGLGWRLDDYHGERRIAHGGSWVGFRTAISRYPDRKLTIVVLTNCSSYEAEEYADKISGIYLP